MFNLKFCCFYHLSFLRHDAKTTSQMLFDLFASKWKNFLVMITKVFAKTTLQILLISVVLLKI